MSRASSSDTMSSCSQNKDSSDSVAHSAISISILLELGFLCCLLRITVRYCGKPTSSSTKTLLKHCYFITVMPCLILGYSTRLHPEKLGDTSCCLETPTPFRILSFFLIILAPAPPYFSLIPIL